MSKKNDRYKKLDDFPCTSSVGYHNAVIYNNKMYVVGGVCTVHSENAKVKTFPKHKKYDPLNRIFVYNLKSGIWEERIASGDLDESTGIENSASVISGDNMILFGGWNGVQHSNAMYTLDLNTCTWYVVRIKGLVPTPRAGHSMVSIALDEFLVFGGQGNEESETNEFPLTEIVKSEKYITDVYNNQTFIFNRLSNAWSLLNETGSLPKPRGYHSCVVLGRNVFLFAGRNYENDALDDLWKFHIDEKYWILVQRQTYFPMYRHSAVIVGDSKMVVFGGWCKSGVLNKYPAVEYDVDTNIWCMTDDLEKDLNLKRAGHTVCRVDDKTILLCGGEVENRILTRDVILIRL